VEIEMGDPVWLDTNTVQFALNGDAAVNKQLATHRASGRQLLIPESAANELLSGNRHTMNPKRPFTQQMPSRQMRTAMETGMHKLGIEIDTRAKSFPQLKLFEYSNIQKDNVSLSDRLVLSEIKASAEARGVAKPLLITGESSAKAMRAQAKHWGIESVPTAKPAPGSTPLPPRVDLADYPSEKEGPISRFFKDRPVLKKLGLIGAGMAAQEISKQMLSKVQEHFESVLNDARKDFAAKFPDPVQLRTKANLDRYKRAYEAALSKLTAPTRAKVAEAVILAFTHDRDIAKTKKYLDDQISKVASAADGSVSGYSKVAEEYIDAMVELYNQLSTAQDGLVEIAADIQKRGSILKEAGDELDKQFFRYGPSMAAFPVAYYMWFDVHTVAGVFQTLGGSVISFASEISDRFETNVRIQKQLDDDLKKVSDDLAKYNP
jgi:hypothetical protein